MENGSEPDDARSSRGRFRLGRGDKQLRRSRATREAARKWRDVWSMTFQERTSRTTISMSARAAAG